MFNARILVVMLDNIVSVNGEGYDVDLASYVADKDYAYDYITWDRGEGGFTQKFPGLRVSNFKGTQEEYDAVVNPFYNLWLEAKKEAEEATPPEPSPEMVTKSELSTVDAESIRAMRVLLLALAETNPDAVAALERDLTKLSDLETQAETLRSTLRGFLGEP